MKSIEFLRYDQAKRMKRIPKLGFIIMYQNVIRSVNEMSSNKHYREELIPTDPSDLEAVSHYINNRIHYEIRHSPEYPIITPTNIHSKEYFIISMLSQATTYYSLYDYDKLHSRISQLIKDYKAENIRLEYELSQFRCKLEKGDTQTTGVIDQTKAQILQLNHEILRFRKRNNDKKAEIAKHEKINKKLHKKVDTHAEIILKHVTALKNFEREVSIIQQTNNNEISRMIYANSKLQSEIRLLEQQIDTLDDRMDLIMKRNGPMIEENQNYTNNSASLIV